MSLPVLHDHEIDIVKVACWAATWMYNMRSFPDEIVKHPLILALLEYRENLSDILSIGFSNPSLPTIILRILSAITLASSRPLHAFTRFNLA